MRWKKLGIVFAPDGKQPWAQSHAMLPTPIRLSNDVIRIFISCCDTQGIARPGFVDVSAANPARVLGYSHEPLLDMGTPGAFDDHGVVASSVLHTGGDRWYMYYVGFELCTQIRYRLFTGLAISYDNGTSFGRLRETPVLERSSGELFFRCGPHCVLENGIYKLWYVAGSQWTEVNGKSMPVYDMRYAESEDGISWPDKGNIIMPVTGEDEHGFGRPYVIAKPEGGYRMFYSVRRRSLKAYRLGYAESANGHDWQRMDERLNLDVTAGSFDSDAIMYAAPIQIQDKLYIFYNGNDFGRDGVAVALLEAE